MIDWNAIKMSYKEPKTFRQHELEVKKDLANGSYGRVSLLFDYNEKKYVVGKFFDKDEQKIKNARREVYIQTQLEHQNIIEALGKLLWDDGSFVIILEYASGGDLESLLLAKNIHLSWQLRTRFLLS